MCALDAFRSLAFIARINSSSGVEKGREGGEGEAVERGSERVEKGREERV